MKKFSKIFIFLVLALSLTAGSALGAYTTPVIFSLNTYNYLDGTWEYGWTNLSRVDDTAAAITDQVWHYGGGMQPLTFKFIGRSALDEQNFGILADLDGNGTYEFAVPQSQFTTQGTALYSTFGLVSPNAFNFILYDDPYGVYDYPQWTSRPADNSDSLDHMITYLITGNAGHPNNTIGNYIVLWEDTPYGDAQMDYDYDDLMVELGGASPVPEPSTVLLFGTGLIGLVAFGRRKLQI